jgi:hypothetical protein
VLQVTFNAIVQKNMFQVYGWEEPVRIFPSWPFRIFLNFFSDKKYVILFHILGKFGWFWRNRPNIFKFGSKATLISVQNQNLYNTHPLYTSLWTISSLKSTTFNIFQQFIKLFLKVFRHLFRILPCKKKVDITNDYELCKFNHTNKGQRFKQNVFKNAYNRFFDWTLLKIPRITPN